MYNISLNIGVLKQTIGISSCNKVVVNVLKSKILTIPSVQIIKYVENPTYNIKITNNCIVFITPEKKYRWNGKLSCSDCFVFINAISYYIFFLHGYVCIHANAVLLKNRTAALIVGDFGAGKTTLCQLFKERGFLVCSGDQAVIQNKNSKLYIIAGSIVNKKDDHTDILDYNDCNVERVVSKIILLNGMCDFGNLTKNEIINSEIIPKRLSDYLFWPFYTPLISLTEGSLIKLYPKNMIPYRILFSSIQKIDSYRGDKQWIFEDILK